MLYVAAPASDQAYEHVLRHDHQQQHGSKKTAKHVDDGRHDDRIQARTGDVTTSGGGLGRPYLLTTVLLLCVTMVTVRTTLDVGYLTTTTTTVTYR